MMGHRGKGEQFNPDESKYNQRNKGIDTENNQLPTTSTEKENKPSKKSNKDSTREQKEKGETSTDYEYYKNGYYRYGESSKYKNGEKKTRDQ